MTRLLLVPATNWEPFDIGEFENSKPAENRCSANGCIDAPRWMRFHEYYAVGHGLIVRGIAYCDRHRESYRISPESANGVDRLARVLDARRVGR